MNANPLISVIVPVYQTERYLDKCLKSLSEQTFIEFEVICVDDCSTDGGPAILKEWAAKDSRFRIITQPHNQGLGPARNVGMLDAKADYIASVDSDDWVDPDFLQQAWDGSEGGKHDIVCFGYRRVEEDGELISNHAFKDHVKTQDEITNIFKTCNPAFWNKLWRKSLYLENDILFPAEVYGQDLATTPRILTKTKSIRFLSNIPYNYLVRPKSATSSFDAKHYVDYMIVFDILHDFLKENGLWEQYKDVFVSDVIAQAIRFHGENMLNSDETDERKSQYLRHLLLLRESYARYNHDLSNLGESELANLIGNEALVSSFDSSTKKVIPASCIVKSFLRPDILERLLVTIGSTQDLQNVVFDEIIVGDDSPRADKEVIRKAVRRAQFHHPDLRIKFLDLGENIGLSAGRNALVKASRNETILLCDDDFIFDEECDIAAAFDQYLESGLDMMGGWLKNKYDFNTHKWEYWGSSGQITENDRAKIFLLDERPKEGLVRSDYILNFFFAKRDVLIEEPWVEELKVEEHPEFFFRHWKRGTKIGLSDQLFVKHTANRSENSPRYNSFRHGKDTWAQFLQQSVQMSGKTVRRMYRWHDNALRIWEVNTETGANIQKSINIRPPVLDQKVHVRRLTPERENYSFGYFDLSAMSRDGRYALAQSVPDIHTLPDPREASKIVRFDLNEGDMHEIGETTAWCHQQLSQLQYLKDGTDRVIYNVFDEDRQSYGAVLCNPDGTDKRAINHPIAAVSPKGDYALSLNFSRLFDYRPGYGYQNISDPFADEKTPAGDGLWKVNLASGEAELCLSYDNIARQLDPEGQYADVKWVINHAQISPSGARVFMLIRPFSDSPPYPTFSVVYDFETGTLERIFGFGSHYHWKDDTTIVISGSPEMAKKDVAATFGVFEVNVETKEYHRFDLKEFSNDGHCSYSPDGTMMLYDTYSSSEFPYRALYVYDLARERLATLGYFWSDPLISGNNPDVRCDLHPRWSEDGKTVTFDSTHEGYRAVYAIEVEAMRAALDAQLTSMSIADWRMWYKSKYASASSQPKKGQPQKGAASGGVNLSRKELDAIRRNISIPDRLPPNGRLMKLLRTVQLDRLALKFYKRFFMRTNESIAILAGLKKK